MVGMQVHVGLLEANESNSRKPANGFIYRPSTADARASRSRLQQFRSSPRPLPSS